MRLITKVSGCFIEIRAWTGFVIAVGENLKDFEMQSLNGGFKQDFNLFCCVEGS
jgi:hypothetical protein